MKKHLRDIFIVTLLFGTFRASDSTGTVSSAELKQKCDQVRTEPLKFIEYNGRLDDYVEECLAEASALVQCGSNGTVVCYNADRDLSLTKHLRNCPLEEELRICNSYSHTLPSICQEALPLGKYAACDCGCSECGSHVCSKPDDDNTNATYGPVYCHSDESAAGVNEYCTSRGLRRLPCGRDPTLVPKDTIYAPITREVVTVELEPMGMVEEEGEFTACPPSEPSMTEPPTENLTEKLTNNTGSEDSVDASAAPLVDRVVAKLLLVPFWVSSFT